MRQAQKHNGIVKQLGSNSGGKVKIRGLMIEYPSLYIYRPQMRNTREAGAPTLENIKTLHLHCPQDGRGRAFFAPPDESAEQAVRAAEHALAKAKEERALTDTSPGIKSLPQLEEKVQRLRDAGSLDVRIAQDHLDSVRQALDSARRRRDSVVRAAEAQLAAALADRDLLDKGIAHPCLEVVPPQGGAGELVRALNVKTIDLDVWTEITLDAPLAPFPLEWLPLVVAHELPSVRDWAAEHFEELPAGTPASRGIRATEAYHAYLAAHDVPASALTVEKFGEIFGELFERKHGNSGNHYLCRPRRNQAEVEADELAAFRAERLAQERAREQAEFEEWRRKRTASAE